ncbi:flagellar biosynthetic protein FliO [Clostridium sp. SHJSY1]|uniref:flagellar biosynthetic protein FliO n=1 Tax=Clostridium sp. SHJSY1 TaxID=2942483 RepID=UPI002874BC1E|nr:flagellar biosynthetic protein FliO [Clostridium sp. SHJSY1]MDS0524098.1 flagellar biosynthetic protein FliO [Clostridium sp. SHJSY1]
MELYKDIIKLVIGLIVVFGLMIIALKYGRQGIKKSTSKKYIKIVDKTQISKDSFIAVVRTGEVGMVILTAPGHTEKLKDLSKEEVDKIENDNEEYLKEMTQIYDKFIMYIKENLHLTISKIKSKEDKHE